MNAKLLALAACLISALSPLSCGAATLLYTEENIPIIYQNVQANGYTGPNAGGCGAHTWFPVSGSPTYPFPNFVPDSSFNPMTFYAGDGDTNAIGIATADPYLLNGLQGGSTIGVLLAPRAISASNFTYAVLANWWFCAGSMPQPWNGHNGVKMNINATFPFVYVPAVGGGTILEQGTAFAYFVMQISNVNDASQTIYVAPRLLQNQYPNASDQGTDFCHEFCAGDQIWHDDNNNPILFPELGNTSWVTSCGTHGFSIGNVSTDEFYCWTMSPSQLTAAINAINAAPQIPRHNYDNVAAHWQVRILNLNMEAWAPSAAADARFGLHFSGFQFWQL